MGEINWEALFKTLSMYALVLTRKMPGTFGSNSPEDLVSETLLDFFVSETGLGWDPIRGSLQKFLCGVLKNKFLRHRRQDTRHAELDRRYLDQCQPDSYSPVADTRRNLTTSVDRIKALTRGDKKLEALIEATENIDDFSKCNQELSERLDMPVPDVVSQKRRLHKRISACSRAARCIPIRRRTSTEMDGPDHAR